MVRAGSSVDDSNGAAGAVDEGGHGDEHNRRADGLIRTSANAKVHDGRRRLHLDRRWERVAVRRPRPTALDRRRETAGLHVASTHGVRVTARERSVGRASPFVAVGVVETLAVVFARTEIGHALGRRGGAALRLFATIASADEVTTRVDPDVGLRGVHTASVDPASVRRGLTGSIHAR